MVRSYYFIYNCIFSILLFQINGTITFFLIIDEENLQLALEVINDEETLMKFIYSEGTRFINNK